MGKKKKGKKEKVPEDPYKDYLRLWMVCETEGSDVRLPVFLPKSYCILGDVFKEMWRITELNIEYDEEIEEEGENEDDEDEDDGVRKFVIFGKRVYVPEKDKMQQCALIYKKDKDLEIEKDLGIKTGDTVIFGSLNRKSFKKLMAQRPPNGWLPLIHPPEPEKEEEEVPEDA